jgi:signal peptidase I
MIRSARRTRAVLATGAAAFAAAGCAGTQVRLVEKSMEPTVRSGEFVEFDQWAYDEDTPPERGDIISFKPPASGDDELSCNELPPEGSPCSAPAGVGEGTSLVKRVIALPGETIAIADDGRAIVNGAKLEEDQIIPCRPDEDDCGLPEPITVAPGHYFVMGDNRPYSGDSRDFGPIELDAIEGEIKPPR